MMKAKPIALSLLMLFAAVPAYAQTTIDISKMTCRQLVFDEIALSRSIAVWLAGYYAGQQHTTVVDMSRIRQSIDKVEDFCRLNLEMTVMDATKKALGGPK